MDPLAPDWSYLRPSRNFILAEHLAQGRCPGYLLFGPCELWADSQGGTVPAYIQLDLLPTDAEDRR